MRKTTHRQRRLPFRNQWKINLLVVWFLGLCFLWNNVPSVYATTTYLPVVSEDFNWVSPSVGWSPNPITNANWQIVGEGVYAGQYKLRECDAVWGVSDWAGCWMYYKTPYKDGKIVVTIQLQATGLSSNYYTNISRSTNSKDYRAGIMINGDGAGYINIAIADDVGSANPISQTYEAFTASDITSPYITTEFIVESIDETSSRLTFTVYDGDLNAAIIKTTTYDDSTTELQTAGKWGIGGRDTSLDDIRGVAFDAVTLYTTSMPFAITVDKDIVQTSDTVTFTLFDEKESTITLTDDKGGVFTPTTVTLDAGNKYTATATYTPVIAGATVITATANDSTTLTQNITVLPYATTIGFVGDSINVNPMGIYAALAYMGAGFSIANAGQNGSATSSWANDYNNMMTNALTMFNNAGVDIVHIFLGANDANLYGGISGEDYKINMQTIIDTLKNNAPIKHVIISSPIYSTYGYTDNTKIQAYHSVIQELVAENSGFVLGGDRNAYEWFEQQETATPGSALIDKIHPRPQAYIQLGEFWWEAMKTVLLAEITPLHQFTWTNRNEHTLWTSWTLTLRIDKYFDEFTNVVKVDNIQLATSAYEAISGSTTISLNAGYLNTLSAGTHTLRVGFEGGVLVDEDFIILPDPTVVPPVIPPTTNPTTPTSSGWGWGGASLSKDTCPSGDFSASYYDKTCWTTADLAEDVAKKVNLLRPLVARIYLIGNEKWKTFIFDLITSCSQTNKNEVIKLACQELVANRDF